ncbi:MAG TPA: DNRLRE domain-containing protein, partial [Thermomicrobiales bacterium]
GIDGTVTRATLRLYAYNGTTASAGNGPTVYTVDANAWTETAVTWNTRPVRTSAALGSKGSVPDSSWVEFDVTSIVTGNGAYSFDVAQVSTDGTFFYAREDTAFPDFRPQLVLEVAAPAIETTIDSAPPSLVDTASATFAFSANLAGAAFECALDDGTFAACTSPQAFTGLADGPHAFQVRAITGTDTTDQTPASYTWRIDTTPPAVATAAPTDLATDVIVGTNVVATFSEPIDPASLAPGVLTLVPQGAGTPVAATLTYDAVGMRATLNPQADLATGTTYTATLLGGANGVKDLAGNPLAADRTWSFTTAATATPLTLTPTPEADTWVDQGNPTSTHGADTFLNSDQSPQQQEAYLRFTVAGGTGQVTDARLRLWVREGSTNGPAVYAADNNWSETGLNWNTRPQRLTTSPAENKGAITSQTYVEYNVIAIVNGNGTYTFDLVADSSDGTQFSSRNSSGASLRPQLIVTFNGRPPVTVGASPAGGTYDSAQSVTLTASEPSTIYYTTDGSDPTSGSPVYAGPIAIGETATLKFIAVATKDGKASQIGSESYTIEPPLVGYRDFPHGLMSAPSTKEGQSKLWFNDGAWWGALFSPTAGSFRIHRLDPTTHRWIDTGTVIDTRSAARIDALWDGGALYTVSAIYGPLAGDSAQVRRFSYNAASRTYSLDAGFPVTISSGGMETVVIAEDTTGTLWATFTQGSKVYVTHSQGGDATWVTPYVLPATGTSVYSDDISTVAAFGSNIGVMWSNQCEVGKSGCTVDENKMYFAWHADGAADNAWTGEVAYQLPNNGQAADDHMNLKADSTGRLYAAVKTSLNRAGEPLIHLLVRQPGGGWSSYTWGTAEYNHTRPVVLIDESAGKLYLFAAAPCCNGGRIYYKETSLGNIAFEPGLGKEFIASNNDPYINNPTSTKQTVSSATGLVVLAGDDTTGYYLHNSLGLGAPSAAAGTATLAEGSMWGATLSADGIARTIGWLGVAAVLALLAWRSLVVGRLARARWVPVGRITLCAGRGVRLPQRREHQGRHSAPSQTDVRVPRHRSLGARAPALGVRLSRVSGTRGPIRHQLPMIRRGSVPPRQ